MSKLSKHFDMSEFICNCCKVGKVDSKIIDILERLFDYLHCSKIIITSGYRCSNYEKIVGNKSGKGYHTTGQAVDINCWKNDKERFSSKEIALALEDLGWNKGIGIISDTAVHIDSRDTKYYFDERNNNKSIGSSFYTFYGVDRDKNVKEAIDIIASKVDIDSEFWKLNYSTNEGKKYYKDLLIKISKVL